MRLIIRVKRVCRLFQIVSQSLEAGTDTVQNEKSGMAVRSEGGATLMVGGKVLYRSSNTELKDDSTVSLPETGTAYVIFKR